ncbi:iron(III) transport system permease protein [Monaibacterium marinum]|uniref:Iron(III) transport system permease protein n=1 Tax=Pontivivens marinum TaxID=1690039 RepID=A0A2C9CT80_9RHOB|nr:iron ABC transporter permease [Monaibacterium marinum]SOH94410.1 iron(III) transport system permease protein [Monaibacterium marinum]
MPLVLVPVLALSLLPIGRLLFESISVGDSIGLSHLREVLGRDSTWRALRHSLFTAGFGTVISVILGGTFAFLVAITNIRAKAALVFCLMIPMMIPPQITALAWTQVTGPSSVLLKTIGLAPTLGSPQPLYSAWGIALLLGIQHTSIVFLTLRANLRAIPSDLVEAARGAGARGGRMWLQIVLPLCIPGLVAGTALAFVTALGNFGIPAMLGIPAGYSTLPTLIYQRLAGFGPTVLSEVSVLALLIGLVALLGIVGYRIVLARLSTGLSGQGTRALSLDLGRARPVVELTLWAVITVILVLPLIALTATSLIPAYGLPLTLDNMTWQAWYEALFRQPVTIRAFRNSFLLAGSAALVLMMLCIPLAWLSVRRPTRLTRLADLLADLPYALPGVVLAIACILLFIRIPSTDWSLYGTFWIIFIAYLARFLVVMLRPIQSSFVQIDPAMEEAAQAVGAGPMRRLFQILLPMAAPAAAAGAILVFLTAFNELTVSALLWSSGTQTLGVVIFNLDDSGETVMAAAVAMMVVLVVVALMGLLQLTARRLPSGVVPWQN